MTFDEILTQILELLQRDGRVSYRALKRRFELDEEYLEDLKAEIIQAKKLAVDEDGAVLVWTGGSASVSAQERAPLAYTPAYLAEKILAPRAALEGERKQVTVLFADLKGSTELIAGLDPADIEQVKSEKKSFTFRWMLRQITLADLGKGQPWHRSMWNAWII